MDPNQQTRVTVPHHLTELSPRDKWIIEHVLLEFEGFYAGQLKGGVLSDRQMRVWCDYLADWPDKDILATWRFVKQDCPRVPTPSDWYRLRPKPEEHLAPFLSETPAASFDRLSKNATGWGKIVCELTKWGLKTRDGDGNNSMPEAYDKIIAAAHEWNIPRREIDAFAEAKQIVLSMRERSKSRSPLRGKRKGVPVS